MSERSHDTKSNIRVRAVLSFFLFLLFVLSSIAACSKVVFTNPSFIEKKLSSYDYTLAYRQDVINYASDCFTKEGLSNAELDSVLTAEKAQELTDTYINSIINAKSGYTQETVALLLDDLQKGFYSQVKKRIKETDYKFNKETAQNISENIKNYAKSELEIPASSYVETYVNIGQLASAVACVLSVLLSAVFALILYFVGAKRYRSVRAISISFMSAGFYDLILSLIVVIISKVKTVDIYPIYLRQAFYSFVNGSIASVAFAGGFLLLVSLLLVTVVWKMKRNEN